MSLGSLGHQEDFATLEAIAVGQDEELASGALAGLVMSNKRDALQLVERISGDASLPEQRRKLAAELLALPRPPA